MVFKNNLELFNRCRNQFGLTQIARWNNDTSILFEETRSAAYKYINTNKGLLPDIPFPELHPYLYHTYNPNFSLSILGTFPTANHIKDVLNCKVYYPSGKLLPATQIPFYHGNRARKDWNILFPNVVPAQIEDREDVKQQVLEKLDEHHVNYFDVISQCQRTDNYYAPDDSGLRNILINEEKIELAIGHSNTLLFNTSSTLGINGLQFYSNGNFSPQNNSFDIFLWYILEKNYTVSFALQDNHWMHVHPSTANDVTQMMRTKIIFKMKINHPYSGEKIFTVVTPPSAVRRLGINPCYMEKYFLYPNLRRYYPNTPTGFKQFIYRETILGNTQDLWSFNISAIENSKSSS